MQPEQWGELERFFGPSGAYSNCWCAWWRTTAKDFSAGAQQSGAGNRDLLQQLVADGRVPGLLAYEEETPVGWVSVGPRSDFGRLLRSRKLKPAGPDDPQDGTVWSVVCFWIPRAHRGKGVATVLLDAAVRRATAEQATAIEGSPSQPTVASRAPTFSPGHSRSSSGPVSQEVRRVGGRPVVRLVPVRPR